VGPLGGERPAVRADDGDLFDLTPLTDDIDGTFLTTEGVARARDALAAGTLPRLAGALEEMRVGAPIARPGAVVCIAGYLVANDVSERAWQKVHSGGQWSKSKSAATFSPLGP
jgi:hypothetical protein